MNVLLTQVTEAGRSVLIDNTLDSNADAHVFVEALQSFDNYILCSGRFANTDGTYLNLNGKDLDYGMITNIEQLWEFLNGC